MHVDRGAPMPKKPPFDRYSVLWTLLNLTNLIQIGSRREYAVHPKFTADRFQSAPTNYFGASIFISYIIAALVLTSAITGELDAAYRRVKARRAGSAAQWMQFKIFVALSSTSFAVLSYNMLSFLITSYNTWSESQSSVSLSSSPSALRLAMNVWQWTIHSTLFLDFAQSLCASQQSYWWVMQALMATMVTNVVIQSAGRRWNLKTGYYVAIGQILPISFAMNLFSVSLLLAQMAEDSTEGEQDKASKSTSERRRMLPVNNKQSLLPLWTLGVVMVLYRTMLYLLPQTPDELQFMATVLLTRSALYTVSFIEIPTTRALDKRFAILHLSVLRVYVFQQVISTIGARTDMKLMLDQAWSVVESPAVAALGVDFLLWFGSVWELEASGLLDSPRRETDEIESIW